MMCVWMAKSSQIISQKFINIQARFLYHAVVKGGASSRYENVCKSSSTDVVEVVDWVSTYISL